MTIFGLPLLDVDHPGQFLWGTIELAVLVRPIVWSRYLGDELAPRPLALAT